MSLALIAEVPRTFPLYLIAQEHFSSVTRTCLKCVSGLCDSRGRFYDLRLKTASGVVMKNVSSSIHMRNYYKFAQHFCRIHVMDSSKRPSKADTNSTPIGTTCNYCHTRPLRSCPIKKLRLNILFFTFF
jgi:hypothetical protein